MDVGELRRLLADVAAGVTDVEEAARILGDAPLAGFTDLGFARLDTNRGLRTGDPEVVYGAGKTPDQVVALLGALHDRSADRPALATRIAPEALAAVRTAFPDATVDEIARCAALGGFPPPTGRVVVVSAGTSDEPVAAEAAFVARGFGADVRRVCDVGVAGL
ncbi:MAG: hypothetical protein ACTHK4_03855, partial [Mycobacteriales bacterium]